MKYLFCATLPLCIALFGATACDSGGMDTSVVPAARWNEARGATAGADGPTPPPAYFGDEYAQVQRALREQPGEPAPTF